MRSVLRVAVVAKIPVLREGLRALLTADEEIKVRVFAEYDSELIFGAGQDEWPDVILIDVEVLEREGWGMLIESPELVPRIATLIIGDAPSDPRAIQALALGASGLLPRNATAGQMIAAVRAARQGLLVFDPVAKRDLFRAPGVGPPGIGELPDAADEDDRLPNDLVEPLSPRELDVLRLMARGLANKQIAAQLSISEHTVKFHIRSILGKMGATNRTEAVTLGLQKGFVSL